MVKKTLMSKTNLKESQTVFTILALSIVMVMASISIVSPAQVAIAQDDTENSTDAEQSEREYKDGEKEGCPFKDKKTSSASNSEGNT